MKRIITGILLILLAGSLPAQTERLSLDRNWKFHLGDISYPQPKGVGQTYDFVKTGYAPGAANYNYNDSAWRVLDLPHDWVIEQDFREDGNVSQGARDRGIGWYRKSFMLDSNDIGKHLELQLDGIATYCTIWFNGIVVHRNFCGYTSSNIDITALAYYDKKNQIAIRVDADNMEGWWYEGGGIYRHTWLVKRNPVHIITDGVYANPVKSDGNRWGIPGEVTLENSGTSEQQADVTMELFSPDGKSVSSAREMITVPVLSLKVCKVLPLTCQDPSLWSPETPVLYTIKTTVRVGGQITDEQSQHCGFRTIEFRADSGFFLNGHHYKIKGVCNHQDAGGVGTAIPDSLWTIRIRKLKDMGANAYRSAHNPPCQEFLDACDLMGLLVMDENRNFNSTPEYMRQLQWLVRRDRNHPSIILWSVFNEEPVQGTQLGYEMARRLVKELKQLDTTRPVTAAMNGGQFAPINVAQAVDVVGFNYFMYDYDRFHKTFPTIPMTSSEDGSALIVRGEYSTDTTHHILDSYDTQAPSWGAPHRTVWKTINERPFVAGSFYWTGFDYHGEPTPYRWPTVSSHFGIMDLCGFPKSAYYIHQAQWRSDLNVLHLIPHWNWPSDSIGKNIKVMAISNVENITLKLNGKTIGSQPADYYEMNTFYVPYQPGKLEAIGYRGGKEVARSVVETTGAPVALRLSADQTGIDGDGRDVMTITVSCVDAKGRAVPTANLPVNFEISGPANIIGLGNGDPNSHEAEKGNQRSLFNGLAQVIIQTKVAAQGDIILKAHAAGLKSITLTIPVTPANDIPGL